MTLKYPTPNILLIDMSHIATTALQECGYNVSVGTFGTPYEVKVSSGYCVVDKDSCRLPGFEEREIFVINLAAPASVAGQPNYDAGPGVTAVWQRSNTGRIDPRPLCMAGGADKFDRILRHGGMAIVFMDARYEVRYEVGSRGHGESWEFARHLDISNWSFTERLEQLQCRSDRGAEIRFLPEWGDLAALLARGANDSEYLCTFSPTGRIRNSWQPIAQNKFGDDVAGMIATDDPPSCLILLPQMPNVATLLPELIGTICPRLRPKLFPFHEALNWLHDDRYELPAIVEMRHEIDRIRIESDTKIREIETKIQESRTQSQDWYTLLNGTDDELVGAVMRSLKKLGFHQVVDVDEQARERREANLREDIQIHDEKPILIVDVKGKTGGIEDADATQSEKHALARSKEFQGDVKPLTIINCQRNLPPHERNPNPYRQLIVDNALMTGLGLMTTWDVFRLLRNKEALGWADDVVKPVFYRTGRIEPIPEHYLDVGTIVTVGPDWFGILPKHPIRTGVRLAIEVEDMFVEVVASSLQIHGQPVTEAPANSECGIAAERAKENFKKGMSVFLVRSESPA